MKKYQKQETEPVKQGYYKLSWHPQAREVLSNLKKEMLKEQQKNEANQTRKKRVKIKK